MPDDTVGRPGPKAAQDVDLHVAGKIRERRIMLGLTQQQVAERIGSSHQQVNRYERGTSRLTVGQLHAIARALGVDPGYFFEGLGVERPTGPTVRQRALLGFTRDFLALPDQRLRDVVYKLAQALSES